MSTNTTATESAATKAAKQDFDTAARALWDANMRSAPAKELAVLQAVQDMADARFMMCSYADAMQEASARHTAALKEFGGPQ